MQQILITRHFHSTNYDVQNAFDAEGDEPKEGWMIAEETFNKTRTNKSERYIL